MRSCLWLCLLPTEFGIKSNKYWGVLIFFILWNKISLWFCLPSKLIISYHFPSLVYIINISHNFILLYQIIIFPGQGSCVHIARYVHVTEFGIKSNKYWGVLIFFILWNKISLWFCLLSDSLGIDITISNIPVNITINLLLFGTNELTDEQNTLIFASIQKYIVKSKRFTPWSYGLPCQGHWVHTTRHERIALCGHRNPGQGR
jgi:hypothetical protein